MHYFLIFFTAFLSFLLCGLLLLNKVPGRFKKSAVNYAFLFFFSFCTSIFLSPDVKSFMHGLLEKQDAKAPAKKTAVQQEEVLLIKEEALLDVPLIPQLPELPRGCEVTSLAMLLQHAGVTIGKMELARMIKKDPARYQRKNDEVYFGHPNTGFVGDMYDLNNPGYGVYHKPIKELAESFLPGRVADLTGKEFSELEKSISNGIPIWIITNARYAELPPEQFQTWQTAEGEVEITYRLHSVVVTGYDPDYIYFNDPLTEEKNKKILRQDFIDAWVQMGRQAVTYL